MPEFFKRIFNSDFLPHGTCYLWNPGVPWLNVMSDLAIPVSGGEGATSLPRSASWRLTEL